MPRKFHLVGGLGLLVLVVFAMPAQAVENSASAVVRVFQTAMLEAMKLNENGVLQGKFDLLMPVVDRTFHVPLMVRIVTGPYWAKGSKAQKKRLVTEFHRMSVSTLVTFLGAHKGERFEVLRERPGTRTTVMVDTRVVRTEKDPVDISYVVGNYGNVWRIVDVVVAGGISELTVRRSEYANILNRGGIDGLIEALAGKTDRILTGKDTRR